MLYQKGESIKETLIDSKVEINDDKRCAVSMLQVLLLIACGAEQLLVTRILKILYSPQFDTDMLTNSVKQIGNCKMPVKTWDTSLRRMESRNEF